VKGIDRPENICLDTQREGRGTAMTYLAQMVGWQSGQADHASHDLAALRAAQLGDRDTFVQVIAAYDATVFRLAWNYTQSASAATDIYEAVFTTAYRLLPSYSGQESFLIWLFRIAARCCLAYRSSARTLPDLSAPLGVNVPGVNMPIDARIPIRLRQSLMQLPARDRLVFILRHELQFKTATIARMLDSDEHTVQSCLTRAFLMLRTAAYRIGTRQ
jgi:RNA polymerase sigma-70 factor (ECF subfamily)